MKSFWMYLCCCCFCNCCKVKQKDGPKDDKNKICDELRDKKVKNVIIDENSDKLSKIVSNYDVLDEESDQKLLIDEERLAQELDKSLIGGNNTYGNSVKRHNSLLTENSDLHLLDTNSSDFVALQLFMGLRKHKVIESIGFGNYGQLFKAFNEVKQRDVAIKVIDIKTVGDKYSIKFMPREVNIIRKLNHKNIVKTYEMMRTNDKIYIITELLSKGSIAEWLENNGSFSEYMAWLMFRPILEALDYMHSQKIAHRDLKVNNILLTENLNPKLCDYNYALIVDQIRPRSQTYTTTFFYLAPEIFQYLPYSPFIADIWSLGVCLYVMITNRVPFDIDEDSDVLDNQLTAQWSYWSEIRHNLSPPLRQMIAYLLDPDVDRRPITLDIFKHKWIVNNPEFYNI
ncbi:testis-specific serine/threonine-protein kinase 3-like [Oppia nitens]|uniref:testis-specific serine/threonine-protein kinase 3-like n=1 Tax=Oppia nitens TaxID=1686743 RepID=UPI0023DBDA65|nr:testis-specific serine/threonine-protein kinase 3-like [Oppia nitens]